ncbi:MAG: tandem-95 repeat protein [Lentisphaerae bacterium]|nr:tandem-95 repeat protein [Lentisphaerota bacterium]
MKSVVLSFVVLAALAAPPARAGTAWLPQGKLIMPVPENLAFMGSSVAVQSNTVVVGATGADGPGDLNFAGAADVFVREGTNWLHQATLTGNDAGNERFGAAAVIDGNTAVVGALYANSLKGAAYVFVRSGTAWHRQAKLSTSDAVNEFGRSVGLDDGTLIVGTSSKAAYVFVRSGTNWSQQARFTATDSGFGHSVAIGGENAMVGAHGSGAYGAVYHYLRSGTNWTQQPVLTPADGSLNEKFGAAVALCGTWTVIGAPNDSLNAVDSGAACLFELAGGVWTQRRRIFPDDGGSGDQFGSAVAISGDTVLVGARDYDAPGTNKIGAAYVFGRNGTNWTQEAHLKGPDVAGSDAFGGAVALFENTAVAGAEMAPASGSDDGAAYVFVSKDNAPPEALNDTAALDEDDVVLIDVLDNDGDPDGDPLAVSCVGKPPHGEASIGAGATNVLYAPDADYHGTDTFYYVVSDPYGLVDTGQVVVAVRSVNDNPRAAADRAVTARNTPVVIPVLANDTEPDGDPMSISHLGTPNYGSAAAGPGPTNVTFTPATNVLGYSTFTYTVADGAGGYGTGTVLVSVERIPAAMLQAADGKSYDQFGWDADIHGLTALVGAPYNGTNGGAAYVFVLSGLTNWAQQARLTASDGLDGDDFGMSVALHGDTAVVGASGANGYRGRVYVFTRSGSNWTETAQLAPRDLSGSDHFGISLACDGSTILAGAEGQAVNRGTAYGYVWNGSVWTQQCKLFAPEGTNGDFFGCSVDIHGDTAVVGADGDDPEGLQGAGAAYVFFRTGETWSHQGTLVAPSPSIHDELGCAVGVWGNWVLAGARGHDWPATNAGAVYAFVRNSGAWYYHQILQCDNAAYDDEAGSSVAVRGRGCLAGALNADTASGTDTGAAYAMSLRPWSYWEIREQLPGKTEYARRGWAVALDESLGIISEPDREVDGNPGAGVAWIFNFDPDGDRLCDWTELDAGCDPGTPDSDGDGADDGYEVVTGTSPTEYTAAENLFGVRSLAVNPDGSVSVGWPSVTGRVYTVERADALDAGWSDATNMPGTGSAMAYTNPAPDNAAFMRLRVFMAP